MNHLTQTLLLRQFKGCAGFYRAELMVVVAISLFLTVGIAQIFFSSKQSSRLQEGMSRLQENGQFAIEFLSRNIRMAGYPANGFAGVAVTGTNGDGTNIADSITVSYKADTDCLDNTTSDPLSAVVNTFFIRAGSLWCAGNGGTAEILVGGVEDMQILYGEDLPGDGMANRYVPANNVGNWGAVVSVQVALLINSIEEVSTAPQPYSFRGITVTPTDHLLREVFFTTIALRNRVL